MELTVPERIMLFDILPDEGDVSTLRIVRTLRSELGFSEDENKAFEVSVTDGRVTWNTTKAVPKEIAVGPKALKVIASALEKLSREKKLREQMIDLYTRFVGEDV